VRHETGADVADLSDVPGPGVLKEGAERFSRQTLGLLLQGALMLGEVIAEERSKVCEPAGIAKRDERHLEALHAIVEVLSEGFGGDFLSSSFRFVARMIWTSTGKDLVSPIGWTLRVSRTRNRSACPSCGISPTSSSRRTPLWAARNNPGASVMAHGGLAYLAEEAQCRSVTPRLLGFR